MTSSGQRRYQDGQLRQKNWAATDEELKQTLGALDLDGGANVPPDLASPNTGKAEQVPDARLTFKRQALVFAAGAVSGIVSRTLTAPLDR